LIAAAATLAALGKIGGLRAKPTGRVRLVAGARDRPVS